MSKLRVLGIAPYEGIKTLMMQAAERRNDIELTAYVGDLNEGLRIASKFTPEDFDIIISRGGTAELIQEKCSIPVVEINISPMDILRSIKLAHNVSNKYALVGFPSITKNAYLLCDLLQYDIEIYTIHNKSEAEEILAELSQKGFNMILCDMVTYSLAQTIGLTAILITSGMESIEIAFDEAIKLRKNYRNLKAQINFFKTLLQGNPYAVCVYDENYEAVYSIKCDLIPDNIKNEMRDKVSHVLKEKNLRMYKAANSTLYDIIGVCTPFNQKNYVVFYIDSSKESPSMIKDGIQSLNKDDVIYKLFNSFYGVIQPVLFTDSFIKKYADCNFPIMIIGEEGTGKEPLAYTLYAKSKLNNRPLIVINCIHFTSIDWVSLNDTPTTIYFKNMECMSKEQFDDLFSHIHATKLYAKNRLIFTFTATQDEEVIRRSNQIINHFSCVTIQVPPLREQVDLIPDLSSVYISNLSLSMTKKVLGFEPDALNIMKAYNWPGNYNQFKRIINELVLNTDTSYIKASTVNVMLKKELLPPPSGNDSDSIKLSLNNKTLEEINLDIIRQVLEEENGNQSSAAKRLGISRTTLWRMLQKKTTTDR